MPIGLIVKAIGSGVSIVAEATAARKASSLQTASSQQGLKSVSPTSTNHDRDLLVYGNGEDEKNPTVNSDNHVTDDEVTWDLEEAAANDEPKKVYDFKGQPSVKSLVNVVVSKSPPPP